MSVFMLPENPSPLQFLSRNLGQGIGGGIQQSLDIARQHREEERQKRLQAEEIGSLQKRLEELGPEASALDKFAAISASPGSEKTKEALREALRFEGAKNFAQKVRENESDLSIADILEGQALGFIPPGSGQELLRSVSGAREGEAAAKIYTPAYQENLKAAKAAKEGLAIAKQQREILKRKKNWGPLDFDNLVSKFGISGAASPDGQKFQAALLGYLNGEKSRFGVRISDADLKLIQNKLPDLARSREGNEAILDLKESEFMFQKLLSEAEQNVLKKNKRFTYDFPQQVDEELESLLKQHPEVEKYYSQSAEELKKLAGEENSVDQGDFNFEQLPPASEHEGEYFEDDKGVVYRSNGKSWRKVK